ncbi:Crp/Fnr family transcriptional regulator [Sphingorhabdus sp.]|uniref:Crp/Fnr family transcriptional regulator n=1 Tax=Sphingorhabdus sp. TaxID=1902408 RepID=UPI00391D9C2E
MTVADEAAILALPFTVRRLRSGAFIAREGDSPQQTCVLLSGFAIRHKLAGDGGRQIFSIHMRGDVVDLHNSLLRWSDHNVQALTEVEAAFIPMSSIKRLIVSHPLVAYLLWYETLVDGSIFREWTLNVGRRDGRARLAHVLCEFALRLKMAGLGEQNDYELPMSQDELADVLALSPVHVSRVIKALSAEGCITKTKRTIRIDNWALLRQIGDFDPRYLHYNGSRG